MPQTNLNLLTELPFIELACTKETSFNEHPANDAEGNCINAACIVTQLFKAKIFTCNAIVNGKKVLHAYNVLNATFVDITRRQFPFGTEYTDHFETTLDALINEKWKEDKYSIFVQNYLKLRKHAT